MSKGVNKWGYGTWISWNDLTEMGKKWKDFRGVIGSRSKGDWHKSIWCELGSIGRQVTGGSTFIFVDVDQGHKTKIHGFWKTLPKLPSIIKRRLVWLEEKTYRGRDYAVLHPPTLGGS